MRQPLQRADVLGEIETYLTEIDFLDKEVLALQSYSEQLRKMVIETPETKAFLIEFDNYIKNKLHTRPDEIDNLIPPDDL